MNTRQESPAASSRFRAIAEATNGTDDFINTFDRETLDACFASNNGECEKGAEQCADQQNDIRDAMFQALRARAIQAYTNVVKTKLDALQHFEERTDVNLVRSTGLVPEEFVGDVATELCNWFFAKRQRKVSQVKR